MSNDCLQVMVAVKKTRKMAPMGASAITDSYKEHVLLHGEPRSVFAFCKELNISEGDFYKHYTSFQAIEKSIWLEYVQETRKGLESDKAFSNYTSREKILAFYFGLVEILKKDRSFVIHKLSAHEKKIEVPAFLKGFKKSFDEFIKALITEGVASGEIAKRPYLDDRYYHLFWVHFMFIVQFWRYDDSTGFENTDAAIEKSVNLAFDLIGKGILDNAIDFGKFLFQTAKN